MILPCCVDVAVAVMWGVQTVNQMDGKTPQISFPEVISGLVGIQIRHFVAPCPRTLILNNKRSTQLPRQQSTRRISKSRASGRCVSTLGEIDRILMQHKSLFNR